MEAPNLYLCVEIVPLPGTEVPDEAGTDAIFRMAASNPSGFWREWRAFESLGAAEEYSERSATLDIVPLVIEPNPILGY